MKEEHTGTDDRPPIPEPVKREVRQRCGFGCVLCGLILYEYDHLLGWRLGQDPKDIVLLCDRHHKERTNGWLTVGEVRSAQADPVNLREGVSAPFDLRLAGDQCRMDVGSNVFVRSFREGPPYVVPILVDGLTLLGFTYSDEHLLLQLRVFDRANEPILTIEDNELVYSVSPWDIELVGTRLRIRERARRFLVDITFTPPNAIKVDRARLCYNGVEVWIGPRHLSIRNNEFTVANSYFEGAPFVLAIGQIWPGQCWQYFPDVPRDLDPNEELPDWVKDDLDAELGDEPPGP